MDQLALNFHHALVSLNSTECLDPIMTACLAPRTQDLDNMSLARRQWRRESGEEIVVDAVRSQKPIAKCFSQASLNAGSRSLEISFWTLW